MTTRIATLTLGLLALPAPSATAQERLLQPSDVPARTATAERLEAAIEPGHDLLTTIALAATAGTRLTDGSRAAARLDTALRRAHADSDSDRERALERLRLDLGDLLDTLRFRIVREAELPEGFPEPVAVDELELRHYPAYRMARTEMGAGGSNGAFWPLFQHIKKNEIAMTAPVQTDYRAEGERPATMAFLYGSRDIAPGRTAGAVEVVDVPAITVLSIGAIGADRAGRIEELERRLRAFVAASPTWRVAGPLRTMGYNSPMVGRDRRYFEVQLPVETVAVER